MTGERKLQFVTLSLAALIALAAVACGDKEIDDSAPAPAPTSEQAQQGGNMQELPIYNELIASYEAAKTNGTLEESTVNGVHTATNTQPDPKGDMVMVSVSESCEGHDLHQNYQFQMGVGDPAAEDFFQAPGGASITLLNSPHCPEGVYVALQT